MHSYISRIRSAFTSINWRSRTVQVVAGIAVVAVAALVVYLSTSSSKEAAVEIPPRVVETVSVSQFAQKFGPKTASASSHETVLRAEGSGMVRQVVPVGSRVAADQIVAQLDNQSQSAALLQAEGALDSAKASQQKVSDGTRSEQRAILETAYETAQNAAVSALLSAYGTGDSAIRDSADQMFDGIDRNMPKLKFTTPDSNRDIRIQDTRLNLNGSLSREKSKSTSLTTSDNLILEIDTTSEEIRAMRSFTDLLIAALNDAIPNVNVSATQIATYKASVSASRTALTSALSSLTTAKNNVVSAQKSLEQAQTGAVSTDIASAAATVKQSQGAYASAVAAYEKTLIRARVAGTVIACSVQVGDVITMGADVCRTVSTGADLGASFALPLSSVKYTPAGAYVFTVQADNTLKAIPVETGLVTANSITVIGLSGTEMIVRDVRGFKAGDTVEVK